MTYLKSKRAPARMLMAAAAAIALTAGVAHAQTAGSTLRGRVTEHSAAASGSTVVAVSVHTGYTLRAVAGEGGAFALTALPPDTYRVTVTAPDGAKRTDEITLPVGQTIDYDFEVGATQVAQIVVTTRRPVEVRTAVVGTNVSRFQIENLPQDERNFLNFAALAPGVSVSTDKERKVFQAGADPANETNVFIDGNNTKNNILRGGTVGQDASRGNPFPQSAVQEFRVETQNFKAEYEQAGTAIITAVTKSGTNEFHGSAFTLYSDKSMIADDPFARATGQPKPDYQRLEYGAELGGPIIKDKLFFYFNYEADQENRSILVNPPVYAGIDPNHPGSPVNTPATNAAVAALNGNYASPFRENLYFGKLTWLPGEGNKVDLIVKERTETENVDFGGGTAYQNGRNKTNNENNISLQWNYTSKDIVNEASLNFMQYAWHPVPFAGGIQQSGDGLKIGGNSYDQDKGQRGFTIKDNLSFTNLDWYGHHLVKVGAKVDFMKYTAMEEDSAAGVFNYGFQQTKVGGATYKYDSGQNFITDPNTVPVSATIGEGDPTRRGNNVQIGLFAQDDWQLTPQLTMNLGIRWDYEANMLNNSFVTPAALETALLAYSSNVDWTKYFSTGKNRHSPTDEIQPRLGISYDVFNDRRTVLFAGAGRYYDRVLYDFAQVESARQNWHKYNVNFVPSNFPIPAGSNAVYWDPKYLQTANLLQVAKSHGGFEQYLMANDTPVPFTDQVDFGVRQKVGPFQTAITFAANHGQHQFQWILGNQFPAGAGPNGNGWLGSDGKPCTCQPWSYAPKGYGNILISDSSKQSWYQAIYLTAEKSYTPASKWGMTVSYTYANAKATGNGDEFAFDYQYPDLYGKHPVDTVARHTLVMSGTIGLPWDIRASTLINLNSGAPYDEQDRSAGNSNYRYRVGALYPRKFDFIFHDAWAYRDVDLSLAKDFTVLHGNVLTARFDAFNIFDFHNYTYSAGKGGTVLPGGVPSQLPDDVILQSERKFQFGLSYKF